MSAGALAGDDRTHGRPPLALGPLVGLAAAKFTVHAILASRYGFHRDELYYLTCGRHLAWSYVDHPLLTPLVARVVELLAGPSLVALRLVVGLLGAAIVFFAGWMAREMGGRAWAQGLAALAVLVSPLYLLANGLFQTVTFDQIAWVVCGLLLVRALRDDRPRPLLWIGFVAGFGLLAKHTILVFGFALVVALALTRHRRLLRTPWLWMGGALAIAIALPGVLWQVAHDWPTLEFMANRGARNAAEFPPPVFLALQALFIGPANLPLFAAGLAFLFGGRGAAYRPLGWIWLIVTAVFACSAGKPYYVAPMYPIVLAAGAVWAEGLAERRRWRRLRFAVPLSMAMAALPFAWTLPVAPRAVFAAHQDSWPFEDFHEMFGWDELAEQVARVRDALPVSERATTGILTDSYGEAAAIDVLGPRVGLPRATSAHNQYFFWGPPASGTVIAVFHARAPLERIFERVEDAGPVTNAWGIRNETQGKRIYVCRGPRGGWLALWPRLRVFV